MNAVLGNDSAGPRTTWANEMNFVVNHAPDAELVARSVTQLFSVLQLCYGRPPLIERRKNLHKKNRSRAFCVRSYINL